MPQLQQQQQILTKRASRKQEDATSVMPETMETMLQVDPQDCIPDPEIFAEVQAIQRHRARATQATPPSPPQRQRARMGLNTVPPPRSTQGQPARKPLPNANRQESLPQTEDLSKASTLLSRRTVLIGGGMLGTFVVFSGLQKALVAVTTAATTDQEHYRYGDVLVYRINADVGHGGVSQLTSFVSQGDILVIEVVGDPAQVHTYPLRIHYPDDQPHLIRLKVAPINPHGTSGKPDLLVQPENLDGSVNVSYLLYNTGSGFQLA